MAHWMKIGIGCAFALLLIQNYLLVKRIDDCRADAAALSSQLAERTLLHVGDTLGTLAGC